MSTNSITQGEQVAQLWPILFGMGVEIAFAHRTFVWPGRAAVHCVVIGLAPRDGVPAEKRLFTYADPKGDPIETRHAGLTAYLFDAKDADRHLVVKEEARPINGAPRIVSGTQPIDGGHYVFDATVRTAFLEIEPEAKPLLRPFIGADEYLNGGHRWILNLRDVSPSAIRSMPHVRSRIKCVRDFRLKSKRISTLALADQPMDYNVTVIPRRAFLVIPEVSSVRRDYVPIGWLNPPTIPSNKLRLLPDATVLQFGILTSRMHMSWTRFVGGRLKSDYQYAIGLNYNTFPWPVATPAQTVAVETLAQAVLDARALPKNATSTLADLYDPDTMPAELRRAHRALDEAVDRLYRRAPFGSDRERVEHLFMLYQRLVDPLASEGVRQNRRVTRKARMAAKPDAAEKSDPKSTRLPRDDPEPR